MKKLTLTEVGVMQILWDLAKGFVMDVIDCMPDPKPSYNILSTVIRLIEKKDFVSPRQSGNNYKYV
jgi:BlaI family transcriptional regulator, penicillinase repressor